MPKLTVKGLALGVAAVIGVVWAAFSAASDDPGLRSWGVAILLFVAAAGIALLGWRVARPAPPPRLERVALPDGTDTEAVVLRYAVLPPIVGVAVFVLCLAASLLLLLAPPLPNSSRDPTFLRLVIVVAIVFFSVAAAQRMRARGRGESFLALAREGALLRSAGSSRFVDWRAVRAITKAKQTGARSLYLVVSGEGAVARDGGAEVLDSIGAVFVGRNRVPVSLNHLGLPEAAVESLVRRLADHARNGDGSMADISDLVAEQPTAPLAPRG